MIDNIISTSHVVIDNFCGQLHLIEPLINKITMYNVQNTMYMIVLGARKQTQIW